MSKTSSSSNKRKDLGFPMPGNGKQSASDLISRLQTFLPQMEKANQELPSEPVVDIDLQEQQEDSSREDDDDSTSSSDSNVKLKPNVDEESPTIQIQFALTDPNDPMMELLANKNDDDNTDENDDSFSTNDGITEIEKSKERAVKNLLIEGNSKKNVPTISTKKHEIRKSDKKKPLITVLS